MAEIMKAKEGATVDENITKEACEMFNINKIMENFIAQESGEYCFINNEKEYVGDDSDSEVVFVGESSILLRSIAVPKYWLFLFGEIIFVLLFSTSIQANVQLQ